MIALLLGIALGAAARPETLVVAPRGPFPSVGAAVRSAHAGDVIRVTAAVYREPMIVVDRRVEIVGEGWPVLDGGSEHQIMAVSADDVIVRGLVFRNVGVSYVEDRAALKLVNVRGCRITGNRVENGFFGIYAARVRDCLIAGNVVVGVPRGETGAGNGIHLWSSEHMTITGNRVSGHRDGIYFEFVRESVVQGNTSTGNARYGLHFMYSDDCRYERNTFRSNGAGVAVMYTKRVTMRHNEFAENWGAASYGLLLKEVYDVRLDGNRFTHNTVGLVADGANRLDAEHNVFARNGWAVKLLASTDGARFLANDFLANTFDVATNSGQSNATLAGNYWDAYRGYDLDRDGVGDVPFHPVRLFSLITSVNEPALILLRSLFVSVLDAAERMLPSLTPASLVDRAPAMRRAA